MREIQDQYATNLRGNPYGEAVAQPFEMKENSGKVGDIGYFGKDGYICVVNVFDSVVTASSFHG